MISHQLAELLCCPTCFQVRPELCLRSCRATCSGACPAGAIDGIPSISPARCTSCGDCVAVCPAGAIDKVRLVPGQDGESATCPSCGTSYRLGDGYANLSPPQMAFEHHSRYTTEVLDPEYSEVSRPLLGAGVRDRVLKRFLSAGRPALALDLGCGNARFTLWNQANERHVIGLDAANLFARDALGQVDLVQGDARLLPFASETFDQVFSFDVMEHLTLDDVGRYLREARRVLKPGGTLLLYSNSREPSTLQFIVGTERKLADWLGKRGYIDVGRDRARKSDHIKAVKTFDELQDCVSAARLQLRSVIFWNGVFQALVDNLIVKGAEAILSRKHGGPTTDRGTASSLRSDYRRRISRGGRQYRALRFLTELMYLDITLFGHLRSGSFFVVLKKPRQMTEACK